MKVRMPEPTNCTPMQISKAHQPRHHLAAAAAQALGDQLRGFQRQPHAEAGAADGGEGHREGQRLGRQRGQFGDLGGNAYHHGDGAGAADAGHGQREEGVILAFAGLGRVARILRQEQHAVAEHGDDEAAGNAQRAVGNAEGGHDHVAGQQADHHDGGGEHAGAARLIIARRVAHLTGQVMNSGILDSGLVMVIRLSSPPNRNWSDNVLSMALR